MRRISCITCLVAAMAAGCDEPPRWATWTWGEEPDPTPVSTPADGESPATDANAPPLPEPAASATDEGETVPAIEPPPSVADAPPEPAAVAPVPEPVPAPSPPPARGKVDGPVMAYVNGQPIAMATLRELLLTGYGPGVAQQLIANEVVAQEARRAGVTITEEDLAAQHARTLAEMFPNVPAGAQRERLLDQLLARNRVAREQWRLTMRRNALLRRLAAERVQVAEEDLRAAYQRRVQRKVEVQHIQTATLADAQKVLRELAAGADFTAMVTKYSIGPSASNGGLLAPFGAKDSGTPPALREAALAMTRVGEVSDPIQVGTAFHILKLVRTIEPEGVTFEAVKDALASEVREEKLRALQQDMLQILIRGAKVQYVNPVLRERAEEGTLP